MMAASTSAATPTVNIMSPTFEVNFTSQYRRNNKKNGQKNLRCFPQCSPANGHCASNFCGDQVTIVAMLTVDEAKQLQADDMQFWGRLVAKGVYKKLRQGSLMAEATLQTDRLSKGNPKGVWHLGAAQFPPNFDVTTSVTSEASPTTRSIAVRVVFNSQLDGWHYGWASTKHTCDSHHCFNVNVFNKVVDTQLVPSEETMLQLITSIESSRFQVFSSRRSYARAGVKPDLAYEGALKEKIPGKPAESSKSNTLPHVSSVFGMLTDTSTSSAIKLSTGTTNNKNNNNQSGEGLPLLALASAAGHASVHVVTAAGAGGSQRPVMAGSGYTGLDGSIGNQIPEMVGSGYIVSGGYIGGNYIPEMAQSGGVKRSLLSTHETASTSSPAKRPATGFSPAMRRTQPEKARSGAADIKMKLFEYVVQSTLVPSFLVGHVGQGPVSSYYKPSVMDPKNTTSKNIINTSVLSLGDVSKLTNASATGGGGVVGPKLDELSAVLLGGTLGPNSDAFMDLLNNNYDYAFDFLSDDEAEDTPAAGACTPVIAPTQDDGDNGHMLKRLATFLTNDEAFASAVKEFFRDAAFRTSSDTGGAWSASSGEGKSNVSNTRAAQRLQLQQLFNRFREIVDIHVARFLNANKIADINLADALTRLSPEKLFSVHVTKPPSIKHAEYVCGLLEKVNSQSASEGSVLTGLSFEFSQGKEEFESEQQRANWSNALRFAKQEAFQRMFMMRLNDSTEKIETFSGSSTNAGAAAVSFDYNLDMSGTWLLGELSDGAQNDTARFLSCVIGEPPDSELVVQMATRVMNVFWEMSFSILSENVLVMRGKQQLMSKVEQRITLDGVIVPLTLGLGVLGLFPCDGMVAWRSTEEEKKLKSNDGFVKLIYMCVHGRVQRKKEAIQDFAMVRSFSMNPETQKLQTDVRLILGSKGVDLTKWMKEPEFGFLRKVAASSSAPGYLAAGVYLVGGYEMTYDRVLGWE